LKPGQSFTVHVESGDTQALVFRSEVIIKELVDFEDPTKWVGAVETRDIKFDGGGGERVWVTGWWCWKAGWTHTRMEIMDIVRNTGLEILLRNEKSVNGGS
jgi:hypothetical protein